MADVFRPGRSGASAVLGPLESDLMDVIWTAGRAISVPDVHRAVNADGRALSYSAVKAVLNNLTEKGRLRKTKVGKTTWFEATANREQFEAQVVSAVVGSLKRNFGAPVIAQLVQEFGDDEETLAEFERLIAARKQELKR